MSLDICIFSFFLYSFVGWFYESTVCSLLKERRFINRGFLTGPYCPVYGCGAVLCYLLLGRIENAAVLFLASAVVCSVVEYLTGYGMEKLFHAKWWDYSHYSLNLHGRICLYGAVLFGAGSVFVCRKAQPQVIGLLEKLDDGIRMGIVILLCVVFVADVIVTLRSWIDFNAHLKGMQELYQSKIQPKIVANRKGIEVFMLDRKTRFKKRELRFLNAFPKLKIRTHENIMKRVELQTHLKKVFGRWF